MDATQWEYKRDEKTWLEGTADFAGLISLITVSLTIEVCRAKGEAERLRD